MTEQSFTSTQKELSVSVLNVVLYVDTEATERLGSR